MIGERVLCERCREDPWMFVYIGVWISVDRWDFLFIYVRTVFYDKGIFD